MNSDRQIILIVIPQESMRNVLVEALREYECPYPYEIVSTTREAHEVLSKRIVQAIIMTASAALSGDDGQNGLIATQTELPPTVTLIEDGTFPDYLYIPGAFNDWCTVPFSLDELFTRLTYLLERTNRKRGTISH